MRIINYFSGAVVIFFLMFMGIGQFFYGIDYYAYIFNKSEPKANASELKTVAAEEVFFAEGKNEDVITLSFVGDCTLGLDEKFGYYGTLPAVLETNNNDRSYIFKNVKDFFANDDLTVANLEGALTSASVARAKKYTFKGQMWYSEILNSGSIEYVDLSNNHSFDYLQAGLDDTIVSLKQGGVGYFGADNIAVTTVKDIGVGLLGYDGYSVNQSLLKQIKDDISYLRSINCSVVAVSFHWGAERSYKPNDTQIVLAHYAIDCGADLVVGHHPHVLEGLEIYKDKAIFYSLGNFAFGGNINPSDKDTIIAQVQFDKNTSNYKLRIIPCSVSSRVDINNYQPTPLKGAEEKRVLQKFNDLAITKKCVVSEEFKTINDLTK